MHYNIGICTYLFRISNNMYKLPIANRFYLQNLLFFFPSIFRKKRHRYVLYVNMSFKSHTNRINMFTTLVVFV